MCKFGENIRINALNQMMQGNFTPYGLSQIQQGNDTIVMRQEGSRKHGYRMVPYKVVNGGNAGPILINQQNPRLAVDQQNRYGEPCPSCGKGILLVEWNAFAKIIQATLV
jgi:hypothetical protein